ncbi:Uncharacterised protein [Vibrio cholerae]|uniref:Uncharacterized protein n=1 Tax=Vibrio cholerae TaxID=666 RepID=A0A655W3U5_VIBCL|nr:Uncharacterised protein [Vibrio cholerae]
MCCHIAAFIQLNAELSKHTVWFRMQETHRQKRHITGNHALTACDLVKAWTLTGRRIFPHDVSNA